MKIAELNIGLSSKSLGEIKPENVLSLLKAEGFQIITFRIVESISNDGVENCLAVKVECPEGWQDKIADVSAYFSQDCIAVAGFIGQAPYDTFASDLWVSPEATLYKIQRKDDGKDWQDLRFPLSGTLATYETQDAAWNVVWHSQAPKTTVYRVVNA